MEENKGIHLRSIALDRSRAVTGGFPFNVPAIQSFTELRFVSPVSFLVGENGCGKSTLLEAIACAVGAITVGREDVDTDDTLAVVRTLGRCLKLAWSMPTHRGFYMRAKDFIGYARKMAMIREQLQRDLERVEEEYEGRSRTPLSALVPPFAPPKRPARAANRVNPQREVDVCRDAVACCPGGMMGRERRLWS